MKFTFCEEHNDKIEIYSNDIHTKFQMGTKVCILKRKGY